MLICLFLVLFALIDVSQCTCVDSTCEQHKCTYDEMMLVNRAKGLGLGNHKCVASIIKFNEDGSISYTKQLNTTADTYYDDITGSLHTHYLGPFGLLSFDEYCDGKGGVNVVIDSPFLGHINGKSLDQIDGELGTLWRSIGFYNSDASDRLKAVELFYPTNFGSISPFIELDKNGHFDLAVFQTCTLV